MSIKKLFSKEKTNQVVASKTDKTHTEDVESERLVIAKDDNSKRFLTHVRYHPASASNFAIYGSAKKYYNDALYRIYEQYPYDGTLAEKTQWELSSSQLDLYIFENLYPRTNGYAKICSTTSGWGTLNGSITSDYGLPETIEYIQLFGGPHTGSGDSLVEQFYTHKPGVGSNIYQTYSELTASIGNTEVGSRESNLKTNLDDGVTVEFWLKKPTFTTSKTVKEVIFDLWNGNTVGTGDYGRLLIEMKGDASASPFVITCASGSSGFTRQSIGTSLTTSSVEDWAHYAFTFKNKDSKIRSRLYVDGVLNHETELGSNISEITGSLIANIGALRASPVSGVSLTEGAGKLSGSIDEFRFWKTERDHKRIGQNYWRQANGGTNTDTANIKLGVYYKFNEGITGNKKIDQVVLDYSGRLTNGQWVGYPGSTARATGSAMIEASATLKEFLDPIIYTEHQDVADLKYNLEESGSFWDQSNSTILYNSLPAWITEYQENSQHEDLENVVQVVASYFDKLHLQIANINRLKDTNYLSASLKPLSFADRLLENYGMPTAEIFANAEIIEKILSKSETQNFELELYDIKNLIYHNIYNNLVGIYKAKGTEKAFRNLIRCFGVDDELIKLNLYGDSVTYKFEDNYKTTAKIRRYANFNGLGLTQGTVYQYPESGNTNALGYISGSDSNDKEAHFGSTLEVETFFPLQAKPQDPGYFETTFTDVSLFGMHTVGSDASSYSIPDPDPASFYVMAVKPEAMSTDAYFMLTSSTTSGIPLLTSSTFIDVYNNEKWNFAVRIKPDNHPRTDGMKTEVSEGYTIEFRGVNNTLDITQKEFYLTSSLSETAARNFLSSSKRVFIGAHRTDFTGDVITYSDIEAGAVRYWTNYIDDYTFLSHVKDLDSYGTKNPYRNTTLLHSETENIRIPEIKTLALNWDFDTLQEADSSGQFTVPDASSGSASSEEYGWVGNITKYQHTGRGYGFPTSSEKAIMERYINSAKQQLPEVINSSDMVSIRREDDNQFTREHRPIRFYYAIEKSMYQTISEEMLNMFATIIDFNNLVGQPVNRYRQEYKAMEKLRQLFFERVSNTPDLDKYVEFYKWIDHNLSEMISALVPASANTSDGLQTIIESHILERNKYWNKYPTIEMKSDPPTAGLRGINEQLYNWRFSHAPVSDTSNQLANCPWWYERAERDGPAASGDSTIDSARETIRKITGLHRDEYRKVSTIDNTVYSGSVFATSRFTKPYRMNIEKTKMIHGGTNYVHSKNIDIARTATLPLGFDNDAGFPVNVVLFDDIHVNKSAKHVLDSDPSRRVSGRREPTCTDGTESVWPHNKYRYDYKARLLRDFGEGEIHSGSHPPEYFTTMKGEYVAPFNLYYTTLTNTFHSYIQERFKSNLTITNLHADTYGSNNEEPMQGPFTYTHVGGRQNRHVALNTGEDNYDNRAEAWKILIGPTKAAAEDAAFETDKTCDETPSFSPDPYMLGLVGPDYPWPLQSYDSGSTTCGAGSIRPVDRPRATLLRNAGAKRPVNIRNIKFGTGSVSIGNYQKEYEIVQVPGRHLNNTALIAAEGFNVTGSGTIDYAADEYLTDVYGYHNPSRTRRAHVVVSRFSAPGSHEQSGGPNGGFGLDLESGQFSIYDTMNYRNSLIRGLGRWPNGVRELLSNHTRQFGHLSDQMNISNGASVDPGDTILSSSANSLDYKGRANFHKTNRNSIKRIDFKDPTCAATTYEYNTKAVQWDSNATASSGQFEGFILVQIPDYPSSGKRYQAAHMFYANAVVEKSDGYYLTAGLSFGSVSSGTAIGVVPESATKITAGTERPQSYLNPASGEVTKVETGTDYIEGLTYDNNIKVKDTPMSLNAFAKEWSLSAWIYPSAGSYHRGILSLGHLGIRDLNGTTVNLPTTEAGTPTTNPAARRVVYLDNSNKVVVEVSYIRETTPASGTSYWTTYYGKWRTNNAVSLTAWSNIVVAHNTLAINTSGQPQGPEIYIDGTIQTLTEVSVPPVDSVAVPPNGAILIGQATQVGGGTTTYNWNGRMDEVVLWPKQLDSADASYLAHAPAPFVIEDHPNFSACAMWFRMGDGESGTNSDAISGTGAKDPANRIWDMCTNVRAFNGTPSSHLSTTLTDTSSDQSTVSLRLPGKTVHEERCDFNTGSMHDNWYITHEIPRSEPQYLWISGSSLKDSNGTSLDGNGHGVFGHLHTSGLIPARPFSSRTGSAYVPAIEFITGSNFGSAYGVWGASGTSPSRKFGLNLNGTTSGSLIFTPFNLNINTYEPMTGSGNYLGYPLNDGTTSAIGAAGFTNSAEYINSNIVSDGLAMDTDEEGNNKPTGEAGILNAILLSRQGPYGWPSWKQVRGAEHRITRDQRKNNIIAIVDDPPHITIQTTIPQNPVGSSDPDEFAISAADLQLPDIVVEETIVGLSHGAGITRYTERPIVYNRPMTHVVDNRTVITHTYRNNICMYSNQEINNRLGLSENASTMYDSLVEQYTAATPEITFNYLAYSEGVYPKETNRYDNSVRIRENFMFNWHSRRELRGTTVNPPDWAPGGESGDAPYARLQYIVHPQSFTAFRNSQGYPNPSSDKLGGFFYQNEGEKYAHSIWPLDATSDGPGPRRGPSKTGPDKGWPIEDWCTNAKRAEVHFSRGTYSSGSGELQNYYVQLRGTMYSGSGNNLQDLQQASCYKDSLTPAAQYHRRHTIATTGSADQWRYGVRGMTAESLSSAGATGTSPRKFTMSGSSLDWFCHTNDGTHDGWQVFGGETDWEVPHQSGKYPFYDSYKEYAAGDLRLRAKDCSIVPEFRISEYIPYYMLEKGGDWLAENTGSLSLTGSSQADSSTEDFYKIYSHSDFMKKFDIIDKDHEPSTGGPSKIELRCTAHLKLLPYDGFYPAQRTVQLASIFSQSYGPSLYEIKNKLATSAAGTLTGQLNTGRSRAFTPLDTDPLRDRGAYWSVYMRPFFAPGIMFNSIKSGIAVDYPVMTGSFKVHKNPRMARPGTSLIATAAPNNTSAAVNLTASGFYIAEPRFHHRIPFEAIVEPQQYIVDLPITNMEPHPSGSLELPITGAVSSTHNDLYKMAANNFFAEVPEFFLQEGNFSSISSLPEGHQQFGQVTEMDISTGKKFAALIKLTKSVKGHENYNPLSASYDTSEYANRAGQMNVERLGTDEPVPHPWSLGEPTINMYSRPSAFGPPSIGLWGSNAGFNLPYTPPYYDGGAWAYLEFEPKMGAKQYTLDEILENTKVTYTRTGKQAVTRNWGDNRAAAAGETDAKHVPNWPWSRPVTYDGSTALSANDKSLTDGEGNIIDKVNEGYDPFPQGRDLADDNAMQISASLNIMQKAEVSAIEYDPATGMPYSATTSINQKSAWVIQTKFETPILNFQKSSSVGRAYAKESSAYGMWHQYGTYPASASVGIFMQIEDVPSSFLIRGLGKTPNDASLVGSLTDLVGFDTTPVKLGKPASKKTISEALVAVPFIEKDGERHFFEIPRRMVDEAAGILSIEPMSDISESLPPGDSITDMVEKMQKYVFPPKMDFITNSDVQPFAMYVFEFSVDLEQQDLTDIWQNVLPEIGRSYQTQTKTVSHELAVNELMGYDSSFTGKKMQDKLQWMVFKVKQKAQKNYFDKVLGESHGQSGHIDTQMSNFVVVRSATQSKLVPLDYSYNWPYDYFSLIELAKIDSTVEYGEHPLKILEQLQATAGNTARPTITEEE